MNFFGPRFTERELRENSQFVLLIERVEGFSFIVTSFKIGKTNGAYI